ncbi:MAG: YlzJ-like family protein [Bacillota bacterium]
MINYSIYSSSYIFSEWENFNPEYKEIQLNDNLSLIVEKNNDNYKVIRIISSNPNDYLNSSIAPGKSYNFFNMDLK